MKKRLALALLVLVMVFAVVFAACTPEEEPQDTKTLVEIKIVQMPTKLNYQEGEKIDLTGLKVNAVYSDQTEVDVTSKCTTNVDGKELKAANKSFYVIYSEEINGKKVQKNKMISITVQAEEVIKPEVFQDLTPTLADLPHKVIATSTASMLFYSYYDSNSMRCECVLELTPSAESNQGTFKFAEISGHINTGYKMGVITGDYVINGEKMSLQSRQVHHCGGNKYTGATKEVATIVKEGENIVGLNFGKMSGDETFWGWSKSAASAFVDGMALNYQLDADVAYMAAVTNNKLESNWKTYYEPESVGLYDGSVLAASYYVGDALNLPQDLIIGINYKRASVAESNATYVNMPLDRDFELKILRGTEMIAVTETLCEGDKLVILYDGVQAEIALNVVPMPVSKTAIRIEISTAPSKVAYRVGEVFDPSGMVVSVVYSTGESETLATDKYTLDISGTNATSVALTGDATINVRYKETAESEELTATQKVTASFVEARELAQTSTADFVFAGYVKKSSNQQCYATIELNGDMTSGGTYYVAINFTKSKWEKNNDVFAYAGTYTISEGNVVFGIPTMIASKNNRNTTMFYNDWAKADLNNPSDEYLAAVEAVKTAGFTAAIGAESSALTFAYDAANKPATSFFLFGFSNSTTVTGFARVVNGVIPSDVDKLITDAQAKMPA